MSSRNIDDDFNYLNDVLQSDLPDSAKLFFAELIANPGFRALYGVSYRTWDQNRKQTIANLERAGFIAVKRANEHIQYVAHRLCLPLDMSLNLFEEPS